MRGRVPRVCLNLEVVDPQGKVVRQVATNSWTRGWAQRLQASLEQSARNFTDVNGVSGAFSVAALQTNSNFAAANSSGGIQVGRSSTPATRDDISLGAKITHGSLSGQLSYQAMVISSSIPISSGAGVGYRVRLSRQFDNDGSAPVVVGEVGLVVFDGSATLNSRYYLLLRDIISGGLEIGLGSSAVFRYSLNFYV